MDEEIWDFRLVEQGTFLEFLPEHDLRMSRCASAPALLYRGGDGGRVTSEDDHAVPSNLKGVAMDARFCFGWIVIFQYVSYMNPYEFFCGGDELLSPAVQK